jgi:phospholipid/cholesterol/gamma-HCH transport system substrate-binding protein
MGTKSNLELKVGIFVFIGIVILTSFVIFLGEFQTWKAGYNINIIFGFVNGIKVGAPVRFAGVDVGEVKGIDLLPEPKNQKTKIRVRAWIKEGVKIPIDSTVWVNTLGLLGEKYIEIMPGENYKTFLGSRGVLRGTDPIAMHEVAKLIEDIATHLSKGIKNRQGTIGKLLYEDELYKELQALIKDLRRHPWKLFRKTREKKKYRK